MRERETDNERDRERQRQRERERERERQTDRQAGRQAETEAETMRQRYREGETGGERLRKRTLTQKLYLTRPVQISMRIKNNVKVKPTNYIQKQNKNKTRAHAHSGTESVGALSTCSWLSEKPTSEFTQPDTSRNDRRA